MSKLTFAKDVAALTRGVDALLVVGPTKAMQRPLKLDLPAAERKLIGAIAKDMPSGERGALSRSKTPNGLCGEIMVGLLPDPVSRYDCPARAEFLRQVAAQAQLGNRPSGVIVVVEREEHATATACAIARTLPLLSLKSGLSKPTTVKVLMVRRDGTPVAASPLVRATADAARQAARLVDTPPSTLTPARFSTEAKQMLRGIPGVKVREIVGPALEQKGLGGIFGVGKCAKSPPRLVHATFTPKRSTKGPSIALVGKGITYDTGGLHLKGRGSMEGMKGDMGGAAATLGAFRVLAETKVPATVHLLLCLAENAIGAAAYKPDDVLTLHSGKTVEINNTDAEGRLVLGDGVSYAARELGVDIVLDAATLTGAQMVATGSLHAAVISNDEKLERTLVDAGKASGDMTHPLPFAPAFYRPEFASPIADMRNSVKNRMNAQTSCAAEFIHWHLDGTDVRWGHVDLAGPAWRGDRGTGFGVALLADAVRRLA